MGAEVEGLTLERAHLEILEDEMVRGVLLSLCCQKYSLNFKGCKNSLIERRGTIGMYGSVQKSLFVQVMAEWIQSKGYFKPK